MSRLLVLSTLLVCVLALPNQHQHIPRVINGDDAAPGQFPFVAALIDVAGYAWCGGTIIDTQWILTSADCVQIIYDDDYVMVGSIDKTSNDTNFKILQTIIHEEYDYFSHKNDIALIQIDSELTYNDNIQAIEIGEVSDNATCIIMGWGETWDTFYPITLQYVEEPTIDLETCKSLADGDTYYLGEETICGFGNDTGLCWYDKGGPLVCDGALAGVASYLLGTCAELPDVFTRVAFYKEWINSKITKVKK